MTREEKRKRDQEKADIYINPMGQLCQILAMKGGVGEHRFNCLRDDRWLGIYFSYNENNVSRKRRW